MSVWVSVQHSCIGLKMKFKASLIRPDTHVHTVLISCGEDSMVSVNCVLLMLIVIPG